VNDLYSGLFGVFDVKSVVLYVGVAFVGLGVFYGCVFALRNFIRDNLRDYQTANRWRADMQKLRFDNINRAYKDERKELAGVDGDLRAFEDLRKYDKYYYPSEGGY
jgi:hypothetical protein